MTGEEAVQIAATIVESPYRELWKQAFSVLDPGRCVSSEGNRATLWPFN